MDISHNKGVWGMDKIRTTYGSVSVNRPTQQHSYIR
jgi:hypothetical protein